eukprot:6285837-Prymnesium_polylepis.1
MAERDGLNGHTIQRSKLVTERCLVDCGRIVRLQLERLLYHSVLRDIVLNHCGNLHLLTSRYDRWHAAGLVVFGIELAACTEAPRRTADGQDAAARGVVAWAHTLALSYGNEARLIAISTCGEA